MSATELNTAYDSWFLHLGSCPDLVDFLEQALNPPRLSAKIYKFEPKPQSKGN